MTEAFSEPVPRSIDPAMQVRRDEWVRRVRNLVDQLAGWSQAMGWEVDRTEENLEEKPLGPYVAPGARIRLHGPPGRPERILLVTPIALHIIGGDGRVDLEGYPTLNRVKLIGTAGGWKVVTDSNVPLRIAWDQASFSQLVEDLVG